MKPADLDWGHVRGAIIWFVLALMISAALFWWAREFSQAAGQTHSSAQARLAGARNLFLRVDEEGKAIEEYLPMYRTLEQRGIVGEERRLNWLEALQGAASRAKLPQVRFEVAARQEFVPQVPLQTGAFKIYASDMRLVLGLLHEEDLLSLLEELDKFAEGFYSVSDCSLTRKGKEFGQDPEQANVDATCGLRWYTIRLPDDGTGT